jgi:drug/metabolite transporter superfamily protein YnfA
VSLLVALATLDAVAGAYLLWYALRRQRRNRELLAIVGVWLLVCAGMIGYLALREPEAGRLPPLPGQLI